MGSNIGLWITKEMGMDWGVGQLDIELTSTEFLLCPGCLLCPLQSDFTTPFPGTYDHLHFNEADHFDEALGLREVK